MFLATMAIIMQNPISNNSIYEFCISTMTPACIQLCPGGCLVSENKTHCNGIQNRFFTVHCCRGFSSAAAILKYFCLFKRIFLPDVGQITSSRCESLNKRIYYFELSNFFKFIINLEGYFF